MSDTDSIKRILRAPFDLVFCKAHVAWTEGHVLLYGGHEKLTVRILKDITDLLGKDELIDHMNEFVSFKGLKVELSKDADGKEAPFLYNWDGSGTQGDDLYFNASINGETFTFTVESYLCDKDTDVYKAVEALKAGDVVDLEGFLYWYNGANPHITSVTIVK